MISIKSFNLGCARFLGKYEIRNTKIVKKKYKKNFENNKKNYYIFYK